jgi:hypothetical protein
MPLMQLLLLYAYLSSLADTICALLAASYFGTDTVPGGMAALAAFPAIGGCSRWRIQFTEGGIATSCKFIA